jgi:hypothetical protein
MIFTYWEGKRTPYIELCFEIMKKRYPDIVRLNKNNIEEYIEIPKEYYKIKAVNHRVDWLKASLIYKYGGWWLDADTIILKPLKVLRDEYFGCPGMFYAPKGDPSVKKWIDHMEDLIKEKSEFAWAELIMPIITSGNETYKIINIDQWKEYGTLCDHYDNFKNDMIVQMHMSIAEEGLKYGAIEPAPGADKKEVVIFEIKNIDVKCIHPFWGQSNVKYMEREDESIIPEMCFAAILYNKIFPDWFKKMTKKEILKSNLRIANVFRQALKYES